METRRESLTFRGGALESLGQTFLYTVLTLLFIPAAWGAAGLTRWWAGRTERGHGGQVVFEGRPAEVWALFVALVVLEVLPQVAQALSRGHREFATVLVVTVVLLPLVAAVQLPLLRWVVDNLRLDPGGRMRLSASYGGYLGWLLILFASYVTVIGWAWVFTALMRWLCDHTQGEGLAVEFVGTGWGLLWRTAVWICGSLLLIPIPWVLRSAYAWFTDNLVLVWDGQE
jgi:hypothetical protein